MLIDINHMVVWTKLITLSQYKQQDHDICSVLRIRRNNKPWWSC